MITQPGLSMGFRAAGFDCREVGEKEGVGPVLLALQEEGRYGLVAVEERLMEGVPENVMQRLKKRGLPIIVNINVPLRWVELPSGESPVVRLIRRAIGYQIKIKR